MPQADKWSSLVAFMQNSYVQHKVQSAILQNLGKEELHFFCTALQMNKIYLPTKFHVDISYSFRVMSRTKFIQSVEMNKGQ
jgi:hypothetical protein